MELLLIVVIVIGAAPYVVGPMLIHQRQRRHARPTLEPFDPAKHPFSAGLADAMQRNAALLGQAGYRQVADLFRADVTARLRAVLMDTAAGDIAVVVGAAAAARPERGSCAVELVARFEGGRSLTVHNSPLPGVFGAVPGKEKVRLRDVRDPTRLVRFYQALLAQRYGSLHREPAEDRADPGAFLGAAMVRELRQQVDTGYLWLDDRAGVYRPTWKGAFLMTWKLLQPFRAIGEWRSDRRARALARELHLEGRDASPVAASPRPAMGHWSWIAIVAASVLLALPPDRLTLGLPGRDRPTAARLPDDFTVPADFPGAVTALERLAGAPATPLVVQDSWGRSVPTDGVVVPVPGSRAEALVTGAQRLFLARGFYLFRVSQQFGSRGLPDTLALYPSAERNTILRLVGTNGANYGIGPDSIVAWLETLEHDQPFILTGIGFDWLEGRFTTPLADPVVLARRFNAFCPDIVTQGTGTIEGLARELRRSSQLYCWWD
jgi:uncharacterized protein DUF4253